MAQEKVLIVEDEDNERSGLAELISSWGYRTDTARDGMEGLERVAVFSPSIVLTDMKMPRMGGLELLERLASADQTVAVLDHCRDLVAGIDMEEWKRHMPEEGLARQPEQHG